MGLTGAEPWITKVLGRTVVEGCPMTRMMPDAEAAVTSLPAVEQAFDALREVVEELRARIEAGGEVLMDDVEVQVRDRAAAIERAALGCCLEAYEPAAEEVVVSGRRFARMREPSRGTYFALAGTVVVWRYLYREVGVHNGPTVVPLELRAGIAHGRWFPEAYKAVGYLHQALPSREVKDAAAQLHVLPYSRATLVRAGEQVGDDWERIRVEGEDALMKAMEVPEAAAALSVSVDRVTVPMEEPIEPSPTDPDGPTIEVKFRQAYCGTVTLHDAGGEAIACIRYARMPADGHEAIEDALRADVAALLARKPCLALVGLADGAREMQAILDRALADHGPSAIALDFWHVVEKLAEAVKAVGRDPDDYVPKWRAQLKEDDHAIDRIDMQLRTWLTEYEHEDDVPDALYDAFTYVDNNKDRMRYASLLAASLPIGSGAVEATCKTLVAVRMKRAGSRWKTTGGQACLNLRALACSDRWQPAMRFLIAAHADDVEEVPAA
jgi:hypothetical protein